MKPPRNLWPFGIVTAFVLFIVGTIALITISVSSSTDLVNADYYEQEIRYQGQLDRLSRAQGLPAKAKAAYDHARRAILISLPREHASAGARGEVHLYRPSAAGLDQNVELKLDASGTQILDAADLRPGLWKVKVAWTVAGHDYAIEETVIVGAKNS
jgi:hypothetical protein